MFAKIIKKMLPIKYIAQSERDEQWGLTVCSTGYQNISSYEDYPPRTHEHEYVFNPEKGRVINEYQILYIVEGSGTLVTASAGKTEIQEGDVFLIYPGEWHTYFPKHETGWKEYWIGFSGVNIDSRVQSGFFSKETPLYRIGYNETMVELFNEAIKTAQRQEKHFQQLLAGIVNYMLGLIFTIDGNKKLKGSMNREIVEKARQYMHENIESNIEIPAIAEYLNISYSSFRHIFKQYTGIAPSQYYLNLKIQRAKDMLRSTTAPIKEISYQLHFDTPEYFTKLFKIKTGMTPSQFREQ